MGTKKVRTTDGRIDKVRPTDFSLNLAGRECSTLTINLNLTPSSLMVADPKAEDAEPVEFNWHCEKGLAACIDKVKEEFCIQNQLKPIKIFITGPPLSGKSHFGKKMSEEYNVPHLVIKDLIEAAEKLKDDSEIHIAIEDWKASNPTERYPSELLCKIVQWRLNENDCQHRGFILDGFPRTYQDAQGVFFHTPQKPEKAVVEGEEEVAEEEEETDKYKPKF